MSNNIRHKGIVKEIKDDILYVKIDQQSSCSSCSSRNSCFSPNKNELLVEVNSKGGKYNIGDEVEVLGSTSIGFFAVFYAYFLPLVVIVAVLFGAMNIFMVKDWLAIIFSFLALTVYYFVLYAFRDRIKRKVNFELK